MCDWPSGVVAAQKMRGRGNTRTLSVVYMQPDVSLRERISVGLWRTRSRGRQEFSRQAASSGARPAGDNALEYPIRSFPSAHREDRRMKHLLTGAAVVAALAISAPVWAQTANPSGGNPMGMPGPSPGGPGLTPYSTGAPPPPAPASPGEPTGRGFGPKASGGNYVPSAAPPSSMSDTSSATPPRHRHARTGSHGKMAGHHRGAGAKGPQLTGNSANQLNQEELSRLQAGNFSNPGAPPGPGMPPPSRQQPGPRPSSGNNIPQR
jgi:hypothetical protein